MTTTFYLRKIDNSDEGIIHFLFSVKNVKIRYSTGIKINIKSWRKGQLTNAASNLPFRNQLNHYREVMDHFIFEYKRSTNTLPDRATIKMKCKALVKGEFIEKNDLLISKLLDQMIIEQSNSTSDGKLNSNTIRYKKIHFNHFSKFIGKTKRVSELDQNLINNYRNYLYNDRNENVTKNSYRKSIRSFINWCKVNGHIDINKPFNFIKFPEVDKPVIALKNKELIILENADLPPSEQNQIDIFLLGCYTTLSISDLRRVKKEMVVENMLFIDRKKTEHPIGIPLIPEALKILEKHNYQLPHIHPNKGPIVLKSAFKKLNLDRKVMTVSKIGNNESTSEYKPLYEVISWHKARKTAITISLASGVSEYATKFLSGHKDDRSFKFYIDYVDMMKDEFTSKFRKKI
jgi:integrase